MKQSIKNELLDHINEFEGRDKDHFTMFNADYYIIGYHRAEEWLKRHNIRELEAVAICNQYELEHYGNVQTNFVDDWGSVNTENLVNNLVFWYGHDLCVDLEIPFDYEG